MKCEQQTITEEIMDDLERTPRHITAAKIREHPGFAVKYARLDAPHRARIDGILEKRA